MQRSLSPYFWFGVLMAASVFVGDQLLKRYLLHTLDLAHNPVELTAFFKLVMVWNHGISFGLFNSADAEFYQRYILIGTSSLIVGVLIVWLISSENRLNAASIGLIIGGAMGNIVDRMLYGAVADFFYFYIGKWHWPAFNIADAAICIGVVLLCWESLCAKPQPKEITDEV